MYETIRKVGPTVVALTLTLSGAHQAAAQLHNAQAPTPDAASEESRSTTSLTYARALEFARAQSPAMTVARARAEEAKREVDHARVWRHNPQLLGNAGPRFGQAGTSVDWSLQARQWLELGGQRGDRINAAEAGAAAGAARSDDAQRRLLRDVSLAFVEALFWKAHVQLGERNLELTEQLARVSQRRKEVGETGSVETAVSELAVVRATARLDRARVSLGQAEGRLIELLGLDPSTNLNCEGSLRTIALGDLSSTTSDLSKRPDLRALEAEAKRADAEVELGRAQRIPNLRLGARYAREEREDIVQATITLDLPVFDRGQGTRSVARARGQRVRAELEAKRVTAEAEVAVGVDTVDQLRSAVARFESDGLEVIERTERLVIKSHQTGAVPLGDLLVVQRELLAAREDHVDLLFAAAAAKAELEASTGALQ